jgi:hypothetical protein
LNLGLSQSGLVSIVEMGSTPVLDCELHVGIGVEPRIWTRITAVATASDKANDRVRAPFHGKFDFIEAHRWS